MSQHALSSRIVSIPPLHDEKRFAALGTPQPALPVSCRWSLHQISTYRWSLAEDVEHYRAAAIPAIGLWHRKIQEAGEEQAVDLILESGLAVSSLSWLGGFTGMEGMTHQEAVDESLEAIEIAGRLGASSLVVVSGARGRHIMSHARRCVRSALLELGDAAAEAGLTVLLQPENRPLCRPWSIFADWKAALDVVAGCGHSHVKLALDLDRLLPDDVPQPRLNEIVPYLGQIQISHVESLPSFGSQTLRSSCHPPLTSRDMLSPKPVGTASTTVMPSIATTPTDRVLALQLAGFCGYVEVESWSEAVWQSAYENWLTSLSQSWNAKPACAH